MIRLRHNGLNGILADEMGLGKTLQSISMFGYLEEYSSVKGPHLVLVPKTTLSGWQNEFARWLPSLKVLKLHATTKDERTALVQEHFSGKRTWDVCLTTYEVATIEVRGSASKTRRRGGGVDASWDVCVDGAVTRTTPPIAGQRPQKGVPWRFLIIDEAHRIKNERAQLSKTVRLLKTENRLLVTGTPFQNNLHELWALLNFLLPDVFTPQLKDSTNSQSQSSDRDKTQMLVEQFHQVVEAFHDPPFKADVEKDLPRKTETILFTSLAPIQRDVASSVCCGEISTVQGSAAK